MKTPTYEEYRQALIIVYKYLAEEHGGFMDLRTVQRENAQINLLSALAHPDLYLEDEIKS
jgi:hypothetical protein